MPYYNAVKTSYITIASSAFSEIEIQRSHFLGNAWPCETEEDAIRHIKETKEKMADARHHCYAYIIGLNAGIIRYNDDGEPGGTAGLPILNILRNQKIVNCCVVVTRYFGGILLGTGGLVRAYSQTAKDVIDAAGIVIMEKTMRDLCEIPYSAWESVRYYLQHQTSQISNVEYGSTITFTLFTRAEERDKIIAGMENATGRQVLILPEETMYYPWKQN